jgi:hypothetical protein
MFCKYFIWVFFLEVLEYQKFILRKSFLPLPLPLSPASRLHTVTQNLLMSGLIQVNEILNSVIQEIVVMPYK